MMGTPDFNHFTKVRIETKCAQCVTEHGVTAPDPICIQKCLYINFVCNLIALIFANSLSV